MSFENTKRTPFVIINENTFNKIDIVNEFGEFKKDIPLIEAIGKASELGLNLVCFIEETPERNAFCKMIDYGKWKYSFDKKNKKKKELTVKEIRFTPSTEDNDIAHKVKHIKDFIRNKHEVLLTMRLNRRSSKELALNRMKYIVEMCKEFSLSSSIKIEGRILSCKLRK